jgi:hypothetical protein
MKPLFIPLKREFFFAFVAGFKEWEFRLYGPRWNEETCARGRAVLLSNGYGKHDRAVGTILEFKKIRFEKLPLPAREAIRKCYGWKADGADIAAIRIGDVGQCPKHIHITLTFTT